jgi:hypothetical protein
MFCIDNRPRVTLKYEHRLGKIPKTLEERPEWDIVPYLRKLVDLLEGMINFLLILLDANFLGLLKRIEIMRKL